MTVAGIATEAFGERKIPHTTATSSGTPIPITAFATVESPTEHVVAPSWLGQALGSALSCGAS